MSDSAKGKKMAPSFQSSENFFFKHENRVLLKCYILLKCKDGKITHRACYEAFLSRVPLIPSTLFKMAGKCTIAQRVKNQQA